MSSAALVVCVLVGWCLLGSAVILFLLYCASKVGLRATE